METGDESAGNGRLLDLLRQTRTFGLGMMRLDVRQESTRHMEVSIATIGQCAATRVSQFS